MISYSISFLYLTYFTYHNALQNHPCCCKWQGWILSYGLIVFHCLYIYICVCVCVCVYTHIPSSLLIDLLMYNWVASISWQPYSAMNIGVHVSFQINGFVLFFGYICRSGIIESYGSSLSSLCVKLNICNSFRPSRYSLVSNVLNWHLK